MLRAAYLRPLLVVALVLVASGRPAFASDPFATYVVPSRVEVGPDTAATRVVIHGAFFNLANAETFSYTDPKCGVMYFQCLPSQEEMCRMQWKELQDAISPTPTSCRGFGMYNVLTTATLRTEGQPLGTPDSWDLGMGIGIGVHVDAKCPAARALSCPLAGGSGGAAGTGAGGSSGTAGATGGGAAGATAGASGGLGAAVAGTSGGAAGAGEKLESKPGPGCAIAGAETTATGSLALLALGALIAGTRRRR